MTDPDGGRDPRSERAALRHAAHDARRAARQAGQEAARAALDAHRQARHDRVPLTTERIAEAAMAVIDQGGADGLTVRRLASQLLVGTMTVYWYLRDKGEVLDLVKDRILGEVQLPPAGQPWREQAFELAVNFRRTLLAHPNAIFIVNSRPAIGPRAAALVERAVGMFTEAGFDETGTANAYSAITTYVQGFASWQAANQVAAGEEGALPRRDLVAKARAFLASLPADRYPNLARMGSRLFDGSLDERFEFGLRAIIHGIPEPARGAETTCAA